MPDEKQMPIGKPACRWDARLVLLLFTFCYGLALAGQPNVNASLENDEILIGDQVMLTITVNYSPPVEIEEVGFDEVQAVPGLEVLRAERFEKEGEAGQRLLEIQLQLTSFDSGYYRIPPIPISYKAGESIGSINTDELALQVNTIPLGEDDTGLQPIKGIMEERINFRDILPYLLLAALLIALILFIFYRTRPKPKPEPPKPAPEVPAHTLAMEQLKRLEEKKLWQKGLAKAYHSELTHILRSYLEKRYRISAMDKTTGEILEQLNLVELEQAERAPLRELLEKADLVKFAKAQPPATFHQEALEQVRAFVEHTKEEEIAVELKESR